MLQLSRRFLTSTAVARAGIPTSIGTRKEFNAASKSSCGKYVNGGNPVNNYHQEDYWVRRRRMTHWPIGLFICKCNIHRAMRWKPQIECRKFTPLLLSTRLIHNYSFHLVWMGYSWLAKICSLT